MLKGTRRTTRISRVAALSALIPTLLLGTSVSARDVAPARNLAATLILVPVVTGIPSPVAVTHAGDGSGRLFVVDRDGIVWVAGGTLAEPEAFLDIRDLVLTDQNEQGLLGLAFAPDYEASGRFYVYFTDREGNDRLMRFLISTDPNRADSASGETLIAQPDRLPYHNGGTLAFGPDGYLYLSIGDEGGEGDPYKNAQNLSVLFGKILRLDVSVPSGYSIPPDNPFVGVAGARGEIWAYGLRNPWRFSFDRLTGDLYVADVGQMYWEEVDVQPAGASGGANYGWPELEADTCYPPGREDCDPGQFAGPIFAYEHSPSCAVVGGSVYRGMLQPALEGAYIFGDLCSGWIWSLRRDSGGDWTATGLFDSEVEISSFGEDEAGELYLTDLAKGIVYQLTTTDALLRTWARTDQPVRDGAAARTWIWGPQANTPALTEPYREAPDGHRLVVYFDKSRMEITHPGNDPQSDWYVTNGLLAEEMITGRVQTGDNQFNRTYPAPENVAGDPNDPGAPTYASFSNVLDDPPLPDGAPITWQLSRNGSVTDEPSLAEFSVTAAHRVTVPRIDHQVASPFWEFMNATGVVLEGDDLLNAPLFTNPFYATGYPISEAYWTRIRVAGTEQWVLVQCFERRCLTYTPGNTDGWKVETGNVGLHYFAWRHPDLPLP